MSPIYHRSLIITANGVNGLRSFHKRWGTKAWSFEVEGGISSPLLLVSNYLFFTGYDGYAYSLTADTGQVLWKKSVDYPSTQSLFYENGRIYIYTKNSEIISLEASSGDVVWNYTRKNQRKITVGSVGNFVSLGPLILSGLSTGEVVALEKSNGKVRWIRRLNFNSRFRDIEAITLYDTDKLLAAGYDDHIYSLEAISGALKWKRKFSVVTNFVHTKDNNVCFGTSDKYIKCILPATGAQTKSLRIKGTAGKITKIDDDNILFGLSNGGIQMLNLNSSKRLNYVTSAGVSNAPVWNSKKSEVYFNSNYGNIYVLKLRNNGTQGLF